MPSRSTVLAAAALAAIACSPTLDWREVRPEGAAMVATFPCKPDRQTRSVVLAGAPVSLQLLACQADDVTWALSHADVGDPARIGPALQALRASRVDNLGGRELDVQPLQRPGMTPNSQAVRLHVVGQRPDGRAIAERAWLFARGTRIFHVAALGGEPSDETLASFFGGLKLNP